MVGKVGKVGKVYICLGQYQAPYLTAWTEASEHLAQLVGTDVFFFGFFAAHDFWLVLVAWSGLLEKKSGR